MHDIKFIRDNPRDFDAAMKRRGLTPQSQDILRMDEDRRKALMHTIDTYGKWVKIKAAAGPGASA